jgi:succinate dehydrogenase/fumarate reductase cytochrome b subunit
MNPVLRFLFGSARRALITAIVILAVFGMSNPDAAGALVATAWNNFWTAFGPLIQKLIELAVVIALCYYFITGLCKSILGGGSGNKKKSD